MGVMDTSFPREITNGQRQKWTQHRDKGGAKASGRSPTIGHSKWVMVCSSGFFTNPS
jgi:hypothetical protein